MVLNREDVIDQIARAFVDASRPADDELLHPECMDDGDLERLYGVPHWQQLSDEPMEYEHAGLFFLSSAGFRHFLPAYMVFALRNSKSGAAVVDSTVFALTPQSGGLAEFAASKFTLFDQAQRAAVVAFLTAIDGDVDVANALPLWARDGT